MKKTGAWLTRYALEHIGVTHTFGIPGFHNTAIYAELQQSETITPYLVTHEVSAAFMADAISRTTNTIGTLLIVPGVGVTHAASGIGEAFLGGIPLLVIAGGVDYQTNHRFQRQDIDHRALLTPITKATYLVEHVTDIVPTIFEAYRTAIEGEPGPAFVEIPVNLQTRRTDAGSLPVFNGHRINPPLDMAAIELAGEMLSKAEHPGLLVGWGAREASESIKALAVHLNAPVATTLHGLSVFPANHPLHTGMGFGPAAVPAAQHAFANCDCLLAIATRFSEIPTGNYGLSMPETLIHVDINPAVFNANYPAALTLLGDACDVVTALTSAINTDLSAPNMDNAVTAKIAIDKRNYLANWRKHPGKRVNPAHFFTALRQHMPDDALVACDDGNHMFLAAELLPIHQPGGFICPGDFNAMGYGVPAANALKLAHPQKTVIGLVGDGAMMMTGMEALTASKYQLGIIYCLFNDGEVSSQPRQLPGQTTQMLKLGEADWVSFAHAVGCEYVAIDDNADIESALNTAFALAKESRPVMIDIHIDYSKQSAFNEGIRATRPKHFAGPSKARTFARALKEKIIG
ncbi:thiamine pyrophosphate-binding protein [Porticoccus sp.]|uniref:thiamine pyrophosphate-binding protein n=1 Tax=Porticoccus sp. TaxID=2024853 RepID=UPI003F69F408